MDRLSVKRQAKQLLALSHAPELNRHRLLQVSRAEFGSEDPVSIGAVVASEFVFKLNTDQMEWPEVEEKIKRSDYLNTQEIEATFEHIMNFKTQQPEQWKLISGDNQDPFVTTQFQNLYGVEFRNGQEANLIGEIGNGIPLEKQHGIIPEIQKSLIKGEPPSLILNELVIQLNKQPEVDDSLKMRILNASVNFLSGMEKVSVRNLNPAPPYTISPEEAGVSIDTTDTTQEPIRKTILDESLNLSRNPLNKEYAENPLRAYSRDPNIPKPFDAITRGTWNWLFDESQYELYEKQGQKIVEGVKQ